MVINKGIKKPIGGANLITHANTITKDNVLSLIKMASLAKQHEQLTKEKEMLEVMWAQISTQVEKTEIETDRFTILETELQDVKEINEDLQERVNDCEMRLEEYEKRMSSETITILTTISEEDCKQLILAEIEESKSIFPSDIAFKYNLEYDFVLECIKKMEEEGLIEID
jgi:DNA-binding IscR family transcriptional regulator